MAVADKIYRTRDNVLLQSVWYQAVGAASGASPKALVWTWCHYGITTGHLCDGDHGRDYGQEPQAADFTAIFVAASQMAGDEVKILSFRCIRRLQRKAWLMVLYVKEAFGAAAPGFFCSKVHPFLYW